MALENEGAAGGGAAADLLGDAGVAPGGDGGQGAGDTGDAGGSDGGDGGFVAPDWFEKVSTAVPDGQTASNRDWLASKGVKDIDALVVSYREAERAIRDGAKIKLPGDGAKPEEVAAFRTAIGVPEKSDGYEIKPLANGQFDPNRAEGPDNPRNIPLNEVLIGQLRESALKHGTPKGAFEGLVQDFVQMQLDEAATEAKRQDDLAAGWIKEQGGKRDEQLAHVDSAARALGLTRADMTGLRNGLGADRALGLLAKLGAGMAEDTMITGGKGRFGVSGAEAQAELDRLKADPEFVKKVSVAGSPERVRWDRLNKLAAEAKAAAEESGNFSQAA